MINDDWPCRSRCLTGKATAGIVDRLHTMVYTALGPAPSDWLALPKGDSFKHSQNSAHLSITPPLTLSFCCRLTTRTAALRPRLWPCLRRPHSRSTSPRTRSFGQISSSSPLLIPVGVPSLLRDYPYRLSPEKRLSSLFLLQNVRQRLD